MRKKIQFTFIALCLAFVGLTPSARAQYYDYIEIAPNMAGCIGIDDRCFSQYIYTTAEMQNETNVLYALVLNRIISSASPTTTVTRNFRIYLGYSQSATFANTHDWVPMSNLTKVFGGEVHFEPGGVWDTIVFDEPFFYNPLDGNLVLTIEDNSPEVLTQVVFLQSHAVANEPNVFAYARSTTTDMFPWNITNTTATLNYLRPNVRFMTIDCPQRPYPVKSSPITQSFSTNYKDVEVDWRMLNEQGCYWDVANSCATVYNTTSDEHTNSLVSPFLIVNNNNFGRVSFRAKGDAGSTLLVQVRCSAHADWRVAKTITDMSSSWNNYSVELTSGETMQVMLTVVGEGSASIDDITIESVAPYHSSSTTNWYTCMMYEEMNGSMQYSHGIANFNLNSMTTSRLTQSYPDNDDAVAVEYANGYVYMITAARSDYYLYRIPMGSNGNLNSEPEYIAELERFGYYVDMAYDSVNRVMYTLHRYDGIYTIDLATGEEELFMSLDDDEDGSLACFALQSPNVMYGMSDCDNAKLIRVDLNTQTMTVVAETGCAITREDNKAQGLAFDQNTGELVWVHNGQAEKEYGIYTIDVNNGTVHYLGKLNNGDAETSCLFMLPVEQPFDVLSTRTWYGNLYYPDNVDNFLSGKFVNFTMQNTNQYNTTNDNMTPYIEGSMSAVISSVLINDTIYYATIHSDNSGEISFSSLYKIPFNNGNPQPNTATLIKQYEITMTLSGLAYTSDDRLIAIGSILSATGTYSYLFSIDRSTGEATTFPLMAEVRGLALSNDGRGYTTNYDLSEILSINLATGESVTYTTGISNDASTCLFVDPVTDELFFTTLDDDFITTIYKLVIDANGSSRVGRVGTMTYGEWGALFGVFTTPHTERIDNATSDVSVCIYPNPATERINVSSEGNITMLQIYSLNGSLQRIEGRNFGNNAAIDVTGLASGTYLLHITTDKGSTTKRIIVK